MKVAYHFTRRSIAKLTGRETERMIELLEIYVLVPGPRHERASHMPAIMGIPDQAAERGPG